MEFVSGLVVDEEEEEKVMKEREGKISCNVDKKRRLSIEDCKSLSPQTRMKALKQKKPYYGTLSFKAIAERAKDSELQRNLERFGARVKGTPKSKLRKAA